MEKWDKIQDSNSPLFPRKKYSILNNHTSFVLKDESSKNTNGFRSKIFEL
jgi:hypothetical protein